MQNIISLSGGKDSCATALIMWKLGIPIHQLVYVDVGEWEFPQTHEAIGKLVEITGAELVTLKPTPFDFWMTERLTVKKDGSIQFGAGWPSRQHGRWCTREKFVVFDKYMKTLSDPVRCIGFAADETHRTESTEQTKRKALGQKFRYPLIEYGIDEETALAICYNHGINWGGIYELFRVPNGRCPRLSCWCCPHQPLSSLRVLRKEFPDYWQRMIEMHHASPQTVFKGWVKDGTDKTILDLEYKFSQENL